MKTHIETKYGEEPIPIGNMGATERLDTLRKLDLEKHRLDQITAPIYKKSQMEDLWESAHFARFIIEARCLANDVTVALDLERAALVSGIPLPGSTQSLSDETD